MKPKATGKRLRTRSRAGVDNSKRKKHLSGKNGKKSHRKSTSLAAAQLPATVPNTTQLSTDHRLAEIDCAALVHSLDSRSWLQLAQAHEARSSAQENLVNPFRRELQRLGPMGTERGDLANELQPRLDLALKALFLDGRTFLLRDLLEMAGGPDRYSSSFGKYRELVADGRIRTSHTGLAGGASTPFAFDLHGAKVFGNGATLRSLLTDYRSECAKPREVEAAFQATRTLLGLSQHSGREAVLHAATGVSEKVFHYLQAELRRRLDADGRINKKTRANRVSALRRLLTFGLRGNHFALWFPEYRPTDAWSTIVDSCFPLAHSRSTPTPIRQARSALETLFGVARAELSLAHPDELGPKEILACLALLKAPNRHNERDRIRALSKVRGRAEGNWEHPLVARVLQVIESTHRSPTLPMLTYADDTDGTVGDLVGTLAVIRSNGLPAEWDEFLRWYHDYSLLSFSQIRLRRLEFPSRPETRHLSLDVFNARLRTVRAFLGVARSMYPEEFASLRPSDVFGVYFETLWLDIMARWKAATEAGSGPSHEASSGLSKYVIEGGLIARAMFDRSRFQRKAVRVSTDNSSGDRRKSAFRERRFLDDVRLGGELTDVEHALLESYEISRNDSTGLNQLRLEAAGGSGLNTLKDLRRVINATPFLHFQLAQEWILQRVQLLVANNAGPHEVQEWTLLAMVHGLLLSGGCRRSELCHLREGIQTNFFNGAKTVDLRPCDRKNWKPLNFVTRDRWLPDWLLDLYTSVVRPQIVRKRPEFEIECPFLLLSPVSGRPFGCPEEKAENGQGRIIGPFRDRKTSLGRFWVRRMAIVFDALGFAVPATEQSFGMHIIRNVGGHAVYVKHGLERAAVWLGDSVRTVEGTYAELRGELVDTSLVD